MEDSKEDLDLGHKEDVIVAAKVGTKRQHRENDDVNPSSSQKQSNLSYTKQDDPVLESARAEMGEAREENQRLKMYLDRIMKDYQTLQLQFHNIVQHDQPRKLGTAYPNHRQEIEEPDQLVSLSLGRFSSDAKKDDDQKKTSPSLEKNIKEDHDEPVDYKESLNLGLECKFEVSKSDASDPPNSSFEEEQKDEAADTNWSPKQVDKTADGSNAGGDDEVLQQNPPVKKTRVSVRARCDAPTMNDGCQWRKYGQKIAKGNPCPRAYYRCTVAPSCPVRKQVQRCAQDMSILITTYEGTHNHSLPMSATAMASTTSAAASMLLSGSSSSSGPGPSKIATDLHGLNNYYQSAADTYKSSQFYIPGSSFSSSSHNSHPTITLDLTSFPPPPPSSSSSTLSHFNRFSSIPKFSSTNLNFSSSESSTMPWNNNGSFLSYNRNQIGFYNNSFQNYMHKNSSPIIRPPPPPQQQSLQDSTIAAATKAITADPSFQSALAAALTMIIGGGTNGANQRGNNNGCATTYLNNNTSSTLNLQSTGGSLSLAAPASLPFSTSRSSTASPAENGDQTS